MLEVDTATSALCASAYKPLKTAPPNAARHHAYACLDWSERRDHLAGPLATALLDHCLARQWLRRMPGSRAVLLTPTGRKRLAAWLDASGAVQLASQSS